MAAAILVDIGSAGGHRLDFASPKAGPGIILPGLGINAGPRRPVELIAPDLRPGSGPGPRRAPQRREADGYEQTQDEQSDQAGHGKTKGGALVLTLQITALASLCKHLH